MPLIKALGIPASYINIPSMDNAEDVLKTKNEDDQTELEFGQSLVFVISVGYLATFFAIGTWYGLNLFSTLSEHGRILFLLTIAIGLTAVFLILKLSPKKRAFRILFASLGMVTLGWMFFFMFKNYGVL